MCSGVTAAGSTTRHCLLDMELPREVWALVLSYLRYPDLAAASCVSRAWRHRAQDPLLWRHFTLVRNCDRAECLQRVLTLPRFSCLYQLQLRADASRQYGDTRRQAGQDGDGLVSDEHIELVRQAGIRSLKLVNCDLRFVCGDKLAAAVTGLECLELEDTVMTADQAAAVFSLTVQSSARLKQLKLSTPLSEDVSLALLPHSLLAAAFNRLEVLHLRWIVLSEEFWDIFLQLMSIDTALKELIFEYQGLHNVAPRVFSTALNKLKVVDLSQVLVDQSQCRALLEAIAKDTNIEHLDISSNNLANIEPNMLAEAINKVRKVDISDTNLTTNQVEQILRGIGTSKLQDLDIDQNNLKEISPELLATAVNSLDRVVISKLSLEQTDRLFDTLSKFSSLKSLSAQDIIIGSHSYTRKLTDAVAIAINKLQTLDLSFGQILPEQAERIFSAMAEGTRLRELFLQRCDLSQVSPASLARALCKLSKLFLHSALLTSDQLNQLFQAAGQRSNLRELDLSNVALQTLQSDQLASVISNLDTAFLNDCSLTSHQLRTIFTCIVKNPSICNLKTLDVTRNDIKSIDDELIERMQRAVKNFQYELFIDDVVVDNNSDENYSDEDSENEYEDTEESSSDSEHENL